MVERIRNQIKNCTETDKIYLLSTVNEISGFFALNHFVLFMKKSDRNDKKSETIKTEKLSLSTSVHISSISNDSTFEPGTYDFIMFEGEINEPDFESFIKICMLFSKDNSETTLRDFFFQILEMFQLPKEQQYKNLIGLFGELSVIKQAYEETGVSIAEGWHEKSTDKYDIKFNNVIIEVKTTTSDLYTVKIKHDQLFGRNDVNLAAVRIIETNAGVTMLELVDEINKISAFADNFRFQLELGKELKRVSQKEISEKKFDVKGIKYYRNSDIPTIGDIPENITSIEYDCTLLEIPEIAICDLVV